ncbi:hypothetical protein A8P45_03340 [Treponema pallidum subsp. pallidum]|nr:hypothetical protein SD25_03325 [Treponema pallidum subsp. pallidum]ANI45482.1 hypothetical protein SD22_03315 [Treponema pallidum subsp. pallidum]ANI46452.1 hypothetical protein SD23_03320 [Treponema pallidum subsp. pallidum]AOF63292.1 hypothetical protein A8P31_03340 [Treponema pallidum subsp. pallidum]AOF65184.1 hypothetical protein A8P32_03345 [Treponema pallidum subsp. pallidum]
MHASALHWLLRNCLLELALQKEDSQGVFQAAQQILAYAYAMHLYGKRQTVKREVPPPAIASLPLPYPSQEHLHTLHTPRTAPAASQANPAPYHLPHNCHAIRGIPHP